MFAIVGSNEDNSNSVMQYDTDSTTAEPQAEQGPESDGLIVYELK